MASQDTLVQQDVAVNPASTASVTMVDEHNSPILPAADLKDGHQYASDAHGRAAESWNDTANSYGKGFPDEGERLTNIADLDTRLAQ